MALTDQIRTRLLGAIEGGRLVFLCGAGLSMAPPSNLLSAANVAKYCFDDWLPNEPTLDPSMRFDVEKIATHFHSQGLFPSVFIPRVPWNELSGAPNKGHAALADLLITHAACGALSANFDTMIERWAEDRKVAMQGALTGQDALDPAITAGASPLLKFHGCMNRDRPQTLWTQDQLPAALIQARVQSCTNWMTLNLPGKHLVVVGFWTDWGYLNNVLTDAFTINNAASVTVIDPSPLAELQAKAPDLWNKLNGLSGVFEHIQESGADVLDELRTEYSKAWARRFYTLGKQQADDAGIASPTTPDAMDCETLYDLRRDAEGVPYNRAANQLRPSQTSSEAAFIHHKLLDSGATKQGAWLDFNGKKIRVINGAGQGIASVKERYKEPTTLPEADIVICAGANDLAVPAKIISSGSGASIMRPGPGGKSQWMTREQAMAELGI